MSKLPTVYNPDKSITSTTPLQKYLREVSRYPLLTPEEEFELAQKHFEEGDVEAAHRLVTANLRLVVKIASEFRQSQVSILDLIQEGNYGLMQAVKKYNPYKGVKLSSYSAWWIRAYILKYLMDNKSQVKIGTTAAQRKLFYRLKKEAQSLLEEYDRVDPKLIAERLNVKENDVIEMQKRLSAPDSSLDAPVNAEEEGGALRGELIVDGKVLIDEYLANEQERKIFHRHIEEFRSQLKGRDLDIFNQRLISEDPVTLKDLGDKYGVSRERARQIEASLIKKLRDFVVEKGVLTLDSDAVIK